MKFLLFIVLSVLLHAAPVKGQEVAFSSTAFVNNEYAHATAAHLSYSYTDECRATRQGRVLLIAGGAELVAGCGLLLIANSLSSGNRSDNTAMLPLLLGGVCLFGGTVCILTGSVAYIGGKIHDKHSRYSLIGNSNQVGIAYNFSR